MGVFKMFSSGSYSEPEKGLPNPKPDNYNIIRTCSIAAKYLVVEIKYHDCTNYEGNKVMVYKCTIEDLMKQKLIDPHFCEDENYISPIARFEPTEQGWNNACAFANGLNKKSGDR